MFFQIVLCVDLFLVVIALIILAYRIKSLEDYLFIDEVNEND